MQDSDVISQYPNKDAPMDTISDSADNEGRNRSATITSDTRSTSAIEDLTSHTLDSQNNSRSNTIAERPRPTEELVTTEKSD